MNLTRAYTVHNKALCTIGRVQTPTLSMVVKRDAAIASFVKAYFLRVSGAAKRGLCCQVLQGWPDAHRQEGGGRAPPSPTQPQQGRHRPQNREESQKKPASPPLRPQQPPARRQPLLWLHCGANPRTRPSPVRNPQTHHVPAHRESPHLRRHGAQVARHLGKARTPASIRPHWSACAAGTGSAERMSIAPN